MVWVTRSYTPTSNLNKRKVRPSAPTFFWAFRVKSPECNNLCCHACMKRDRRYQRNQRRPGPQPLPSLRTHVPQPGPPNARPWKSLAPLQKGPHGKTFLSPPIGPPRPNNRVCEMLWAPDHLILPTKLWWPAKRNPRHPDRTNPQCPLMNLLRPRKTWQVHK